MLSVGEPGVSDRRPAAGPTSSRVCRPPPEATTGESKELEVLLAVHLPSRYPAEAIDIVAPVHEERALGGERLLRSSLGGAVKKAPPGGSAFAHRDALFYAEPGAGWNGDAITPRAQAWVAEFSQALRPYVNGAYVNVPNPAMLDWETAYWGDQYARLREIKAKYDPDNVFRYEQSIAPA